MTGAAAVLLAILAAGEPRARAAIAPDRGTGVSPAGLPSRVLHDFARLGSAVPLRILAAGGAAAIASHPADQAALQSIGGAEEALDGGTTLGGSAVQFGAAGAVYVIGLATRHESAARVGSALLEAQIVGGTVTQGLKYAVDRERPDGGRYSFPSGHTEAAFATADVLLQQFGWKAGLAAYAGAAYVGAARISEHQHYLSDVVFGAAIGIAAARSVDHRPGRSLQISPVPTRHGAAVFMEVTW